MTQKGCVTYIQMRLHGPSLLYVWGFFLTCILSVRTSKVPAILCNCAVSVESSLIVYIYNEHPLCTLRHVYFTLISVISETAANIIV